MQKRVDEVVCDSRNREALDDLLFEGKHQSWGGWTNNTPRWTKRWSETLDKGRASLAYLYRWLSSHHGEVSCEQYICLLEVFKQSMSQLTHKAKAYREQRYNDRGDPRSAR